MPTTDAHQTTRTVVGSVIGGLAGLSLLAVFFYFLLRWWRRKHNQGVHAVGDNMPAMTARPTTPGPSGAAFIPAATGGLLGRLTPGRAEAAPVASSVAGARSFQRISGRKLPSQWSPGMEGPVGAFGTDAAAGSSSGGLPQSSISANNAFGRPATAENPFLDPVESYGTIAGVGAGLGAGAFAAGAASGRTGIHYSPRAMGAAIGTAEEHETLMPSPARTPLMQSAEPRASYLATPTAWHGSLLPSPARPNTTSTVRTSGTKFREDFF